MKSIRRATPTFVLGGDAEERDEDAALDGGVNAGANFLLGKPALVEKLRQQRVVGFGDVLDQFAVQLLPRAPAMRRWRVPRGICRGRSVS